MGGPEKESFPHAENWLGDESKQLVNEAFPEADDYNNFMAGLSSYLQCKSSYEMEFLKRTVGHKATKEQKSRLRKLLKTLLLVG